MSSPPPSRAESVSAAVFSDDDEYDLISNPDPSLDSSLAELPPRVQGKDILEPAPSQAARDKLETTNWSAEEIQAYVRKSLAPAPDTQQHHLNATRTVRVYVDGAFDVFHIGQALQLRQAKLAFPFVHLTVGVFSTEQLVQYGYPPVWSDLERVEMLRHCRWVDEVITDVPWELSHDFLLQRRIDYVAIDEGTSVDPNCDKARVRGYDELKRIGKIISTRRTKGYSASKRLSTGLSTGPPTPVLSTSPRLAVSSRNHSYKHLPDIGPPALPVAQSDRSSHDDTPEPKLDMFGLDT